MRRQLVQSAPRKQLGSGTTMRYLAKLDDAVPGTRPHVRRPVLHGRQHRHDPRAAARNSGTVGGKFLARMPLKDEQGAPVSKSEFFVGARSRRGPRVRDCRHGRRHAQADGGRHRRVPVSCYASVVGAVAGRLDTDAALPASGDVDAATLAAALEPLGLPKQAAITAVRARERQELPHRGPRQGPLGEGSTACVQRVPSLGAREPLCAQTRRRKRARATNRESFDRVCGKRGAGGERRPRGDRRGGGGGAVCVCRRQGEWRTGRVGLGGASR